MATVYMRKDVHGVRYRVQLRRKDIPALSITFRDEQSANQWVNDNEFKFINEPEKYLKWVKQERLRLRRLYEFQDKGQV